MIDQQAKDEYWKVVNDCLVELFGLSRSDAETKSRKLRTVLERVPAESADERDLLYHAEPVDVAQDIAGEVCDLSKCRKKYEKILSRHQW